MNTMKSDVVLYRLQLLLILFAFTLSCIYFLTCGTVCLCHILILLVLFVVLRGGICL
jgi:hypothetical protein